VIDHMNRRYVEQNLVPESEDRLEDGTLTQKRRIENGRVKKEITWIHASGERERFTEDVRLYAPEALQSLLQECGLTPLHTWGSFAGGPLTPSSDRMIITARKE
jgi:hypothetical protein